MKQIERIISGGQTGADRAALDFALQNKILIGGFAPRNRRAEDGLISSVYPNLCEAETEDVAERTALNVKYSDATLIFSHGELKGGSKLTKDFAERFGKPVLHIDFSSLTLEQAIEKTRNWLASVDCRVLNIAGARASEDERIYDKTTEFLSELLD